MAPLLVPRYHLLQMVGLLSRTFQEGAMNIDFTLAELEFLAEILEERRRELQIEIIHTDHKEFKLRLREKEKSLDELLNRIVLSRSAAA